MLINNSCSMHLIIISRCTYSSVVRNYDSAQFVSHPLHVPLNPLYFGSQYIVIFSLPQYMHTDFSSYFGKSKLQSIDCTSDYRRISVSLTLVLRRFSSANVLSLVTSRLKNRSMVQSAITLNFFSTVGRFAK